MLTSLTCTWVLANDVLVKPEAADLVTPWLVAYPLALVVRVSNARLCAHMNSTSGIGEFCLVLPQVPVPCQGVSAAP